MEPPPEVGVMAISVPEGLCCCCERKRCRVGVIVRSTWEIGRVKVKIAQDHHANDHVNKIQLGAKAKSSPIFVHFHHFGGLILIRHYWSSRLSSATCAACAGSIKTLQNSAFRVCVCKIGPKWTKCHWMGVIGSLMQFVSKCLHILIFPGFKAEERVGRYPTSEVHAAKNSGSTKNSAKSTAIA